MWKSLLGRGENILDGGAGIQSFLQFDLGLAGDTEDRMRGCPGVAGADALGLIRAAPGKSDADGQGLRSGFEIDEVKEQLIGGASGAGLRREGAGIHGAEVNHLIL